MSRYDGSDSYTYPDSEVLQNKAGLQEQADLDAFEADATAIRLLQLIELPIPGQFDIFHLRAIHHHLFHDEDFLRNLPPDKFIERLAHFMGEINAAHPFREGNGRVQRAFCLQLAEQAGFFIDFENVSREDMYNAMISSFRGDNRLLIELLDRICSMIE